MSQYSDDDYSLVNRHPDDSFGDETYACACHCDCCAPVETDGDRCPMCAEACGPEGEDL